MKITVITLFPKLFSEFLKTSILGRAKDKQLVDYKIVDLRQFGNGKHQTVDDRPFGGGPGMILRADVLVDALESVSKPCSHTILMSASGAPFKQIKAIQLSKKSHLIIICGHYEGVDQRFIDRCVDEEISLGDFVLTGGEIPALAVVDAIVRLIPKVLEKSEAVEEESYTLLSPDKKPLLEYPQYTRPEIFENRKTPEVLLSGNHQKIKEWRLKQALKKTKQTRPDLLE